MKKETNDKLFEYVCTVLGAIIIRALFFTRYPMGIKDICVIGVTCLIIQLIKGGFQQ